MKILLLEDDKILNESLKEYLELEGFKVDSAFSAKEAYNKSFEQKYDLYIFDINLPDESGFEVLKSLKEADDLTPTIYISALTDTNSVVKAFKIGAEDYIKKPFEPEELVVRIKSRYLNKELIEYKDILVNLYSKEIFKDGKLISLGEVGTNIILELFKNQGRVVESSYLLEYLNEPNLNALRVLINKLKKRLGIEIKNIRGQGYMIEKV
ncbi:MAG: response regulator transcription factor [Epsilonproteobacteria bacterium]|nr:response regulator transcription factor [Campylobacterota bacterium]